MGGHVLHRSCLPAAAQRQAWTPAACPMSTTSGLASHHSLGEGVMRVGAVGGRTGWRPWDPAPGASWPAAGAWAGPCTAPSTSASTGTPVGAASSPGPRGGPRFGGRCEAREFVRGCGGRPRPAAQPPLNDAPLDPSYDCSCFDCICPGWPLYDPGTGRAPGWPLRPPPGALQLEVLQVISREYWAGLDGKAAL